MKKLDKPNSQCILKSYISALQTTYKDYKDAIIDDLRCSWYSNDGEFTSLAGGEERMKKITYLGKEVIRLQAEVYKIKNQIEAGKEDKE